MSNENTLFILNLLQNTTEPSTELQLTALEQLCLFILQIENSEEVKKQYPPSTFIQHLTKFFLDFETPSVVLETAARVLTYYIQILPIESSSSLLEIDGALCAICIRLESGDLSNPIDNDLAQQIVKLLEELVKRDQNIFRLIPSIPSVFEFVSRHWRTIHVDTLRSGLFVLGRTSHLLHVWIADELKASLMIWKSINPPHPIISSLQCWITNLIDLISHRDLSVSCGSLECLHTMIMACRRLPTSWRFIELLTAEDNLIEKLLTLLEPPGVSPMRSAVFDGVNQISSASDNLRVHGAFTRESGHLTGNLAITVVDLILNLCQGQRSLLYTISISQNLKTLFSYALSISSGDLKSRPNKANFANTDLASDYLSAILYLAEGLLNLTMITPMYSDAKEGAVNPSVNSKDSLGGPKHDSNKEPESIESSQEKTPTPKSVWHSLLKARLACLFQNETLSQQGRNGICQTSASACIPSTGSARHGFDQLGLNEDTQLASDRFHSWLIQSLYNRSNMSDILSIVHSGQINGCWIDLNGQPLLASAISQGNGAAVVCLCQRGADVNAGLTGSALHYAIAYGQVKCVRYLLGLNEQAKEECIETNLANPRLRDLSGRTPSQLALKTWMAARERGGDTENYRKLSRIVQQAEEEFKVALKDPIVTPFANLLRLALPVLVETYTSSLRPEIRLRVLQLLCRTIRSKTGFIVLYQMHKSETKRKLNGQNLVDVTGFCGKLTRVLASAISQGSTEEVYVALNLIPALIDQPSFLNWMHRYGLPQLLKWRSKLYQSLDDLFKHNSENLLAPSYIKIDNHKDSIPFCVPPYIIAPKHPGFQCLYQLGMHQSYAFGEWTILRPNPHSILMFHDFACIWIEEVTISSTSGETKTVGYDEVCFKPKIYLITRPEKLKFDSDSQPNSYGLPVDHNSSADDELFSRGRLLSQTADSMLLNLASDSAEGLYVLEIQNYCAPTNRSDVSTELWEKIQPLLLQTRNMFYGILPIPVQKSCSPFRSSNSTVSTSKSKLNMNPNSLQIPQSQRTLNYLSRNEPSELPTASLMNRLCATTTFGRYHSEGEFIPNNPNKTLTPTSLVRADSDKSTDLVRLNTSEFSHVQSKSRTVSTCNVHLESHEPLINPNVDNMFEVNLDPENIRSSHPKNSAQPSDDNLVNLLLDGNHHSESVSSHQPQSDIPGSSTYQSAEDALADLQDESIDLMIKHNKEMDSKYSGKATTVIYAGNIQITMSAQGLWLTVPSCTYTSNSFSANVHFCDHAECRACWNPDFIEDEFEYSEDTTAVDFWSDKLRKTDVMKNYCSKWASPIRLNDLRKFHLGSVYSSSSSSYKSSSSDRLLGAATVKILCYPTKLGGVKVYSDTEKQLYSSGSLSRGSGFLRLTHFLETLTLAQRQFVRSKHRETRLRVIRNTTRQAALVLSNLLELLMSKSLLGTKRSRHSSISPKRCATGYKSLLVNQLSIYSYCIPYLGCLCDNSSKPNDFIQSLLNTFSLDGFMQDLQKATPFELLESKLIPALWRWLKYEVNRMRSLHSANRDIDCSDELKKEENYLPFDALLNKRNIETLAKKLIETLELIERYPTPTTRFINLPEQLLTRPVQLRPQLAKRLTNLSDFLSASSTISQSCSKQVDLSAFSLFAQPLVTIKQLKKWILECAAAVPWYHDNLENMGFYQDVNTPPCVHLVPEITSNVDTQIGILEPMTLPDSNCMEILRDPKTFYGGLFKWLGTNGGRESKWANPLRLNGLVRVVTSDRELNMNPLRIGTILSSTKFSKSGRNRGHSSTRNKVHSGTKHNAKSNTLRSNETTNRFKVGIPIHQSHNHLSPFNQHMMPWIAFDLGVSLELTHYSIQVPITSREWPELKNWQLQASTNGLDWKTISEHHITPKGNPEDYWGAQGQKLWSINKDSDEGESNKYRFLRIQLLSPKNIVQTNQSEIQTERHFTLVSVEFYGTIRKLNSSFNQETTLDAIAHIHKFRRGSFIVPDLPIPNCDQHWQQQNCGLICEFWPQQDDAFPKPMEKLQGLPSLELDSPPILGRIVSGIFEERVVIEWLTPESVYKVLNGSGSSLDSSVSNYTVDLKNRFEFRLPNEKEVQSRLDYLTKMADLGTFGSKDENGFDIKSPEYPQILPTEKDVQELDYSDLPAESSDETRQVQQSVVVSQPLTSYLLPLSHNWLTKALLPTFNRLMPFLFATFNRSWIRDSNSLQSGRATSQMELTEDPLRETPVMQPEEPMQNSFPNRPMPLINQLITETSPENECFRSIICEQQVQQSKSTYSVSNEFNGKPSNSSEPVNWEIDEPIMQNRSYEPSITFAEPHSNLDPTDNHEQPESSTKFIVTTIFIDNGDDDDDNDELDNGQNAIPNNPSSRVDCELNEPEQDSPCITLLPKDQEENAVISNDLPDHLPPTEDDPDLEVIGKTLELRILNNKRNLNQSDEFYGASSDKYLNLPTTNSNKLRTKFDDWERVDPVNIDMILRKCMNIGIIDTEHLAPHINIQGSTLPDSNPDILSKELKPASRHSQGIKNEVTQPSTSQKEDDCGFRLRNYTRTALARQKSTPDIQPTDNSSESQNISGPTTSYLSISSSLDYKPIALQLPSSKTFIRSPCFVGLKVDNLDANLPGFIPPFETRSGTTNQPSTVSFQIPAQTKFSSKLFTKNKTTKDKGKKNKITESTQNDVHLYLCQDSMQEMASVAIVPSSSSSSLTSSSLCSNILPRITHRTSTKSLCEESGLSMSRNCLDSQYFKFKSKEPKSKLHYLESEEAHLLHYLLDEADYCEEFQGSGVIKASYQPIRLWSRNYTLGYGLYNSSDAETATLSFTRVPSKQKSTNNLLEVNPAFSNEETVTQILEILSFLYEFYFTIDAHRHDQSISTLTEQTSTSALENTTDDINSISLDDVYETDSQFFQSARLTRKLMIYYHDIWSVLSNCHWPISKTQNSHCCTLEAIFNWTSTLVTNYGFLFPFEARLEFWRVSSHGTSRAIAWLQKHFSNMRSNIPTSMGTFISPFQRMDFPSYSSNQRVGERAGGTSCTFSWGPSSVLVSRRTSGLHNDSQQVEETYQSNPTCSTFTPQMPSFSYISGLRFGSHLNSLQQPMFSNLGRLQRHMAKVPRPQENSLTSTFGCGFSNEALTWCMGGSVLSDANLFWDAAVKLLLSHADKKQELEVEFEGEEGTGLGPTMEFYALLSAELRRHSHGLWVSDDKSSDGPRSTNNSEFDHDATSTKTKGISSLDGLPQEVIDADDTKVNRNINTKDFYVNPPKGLFPAPWPANQLPPDAEMRFYILGVAVAKCLQDQRQMDLPFSDAFLRLLCGTVWSTQTSNKSLTSKWNNKILDLRHFVEIYPERGKFLVLLMQYEHERSRLKCDLTDEEFQKANLDLQMRLFSARLEDLCITLTFAPTTRLFGQTEFILADHYDWEETNHINDIPTFSEQTTEELLTGENVAKYVQQSVDFALDKGIRKQMSAFIAGFERVLPFSSLSVFSPSELGRLISGESCPEWSLAELWANCEPAAGYTKQSKGYQMLIETLAEFDAAERRLFIYFVTGCPTLPPGGLQNLHPKLKVAKKDGATCGPFPSVNTCMHYLKLPEYTSGNELKTHLLAAASQKGFYLN